MRWAPAVHSNGTGKQSLLAQYGGAIDCLCAAYSAMKHTAPNARDYMDFDAFHLATEDHMKRLAKIDSVVKEFEQIIAAIEKQ